MNFKALAKLALVNLVVFFGIAIFALAIFEMVLRTTQIFDQAQNPAPSYIPQHLKLEDQRIDKLGFLDANGFRTDVEIPDLIEKLRDSKKCKIVVLGDSYVWGDGLPPEVRWPAKLQNLSDCEVYPFGKNGWSSLDYFGFYYEHLREMKFDYLVIGLVSNDPHPIGKFLTHDYGPMTMPFHLTDLYSLPYMLKLYKYKDILNRSYAFDYIDQFVKNYLAAKAPTTGSLEHPPIISYSYDSWTKRIYEDDIYRLWESAIVDFAAIARHPFGFLLTPNETTKEERLRWTRVEQTMLKYNLIFENTFDEQETIFGRAPRPRSYWANPADGHPGDVQTTIFARKAVRLLERLGYKPR